MIAPQLESADVLCFGPFRLIPARRQLLKGGVPVALGARALDLLTVLARRPGQVLGKDELIAGVWGPAVVEESNLRVQMTALRKVLGQQPDALPYISNLPMRGYCFVAAVRGEAVSDDGAASRPAREAPDAASGLVPRLSPLIGRSASIEALRSTLALRRLVTVTGPGGIGKTCVALAAASELAPGFADGAGVVDFAPLGDAGHVPASLAAALGVPVLSDNPVAAVCAWLHDKHMLLVLDNCEHVVESVATLAERLLIATAGVRIIATGREPLHIGGEWVQRLPALPVAPAGTVTGSPGTLASAMGYAAVQLFVERAVQAQDDIVFADSDAAAITDICRRLDGLPLAIELVAARIGTFGLQGLLRGIGDRLALFSQGRRTALPRHRTLRGALDWSHDLLLPAERRMLRRLAVFRERFDLPAALRVAHEAGDDGLATLLNLVDKSLVVTEPGLSGSPYRLLQTTRSYALERLEGAGDGPLAARRHAQWCADTLADADDALRSLAPERWRALYGSRIDDLRAALDWALREDRLLAARLAALAAPLWFHLGLLGEALATIERCREACAGSGAPASPAEGAARGPLDGTRDTVRAAVDLPPDIELRLCLTQAHAGLVLSGPSSGIDATLARARDLMPRVEDPALGLQAAWTQFIHQVIRGDHAAALAENHHFGALAVRAGDAEAVFVHHRLMSLALHSLGEQARARHHVDLALAPEAGRTMRLLHGNPQQSDHRSAALTHRARILWVLGFPEQALLAAEEACAEALGADRIRPLVYVLSYGACAVSLWAGELATAARYREMLHEATVRHAMPYWQLWPALYHHALLLRRRDAGVAPGEPLAVPDWRALGPGHEDMLATLGVGHLTTELLHRAEAGGSAWCAPEILRVAACRHLSASPPDLAAAEALLLRARALAARQKALGWSLRIQCSLSTLREAQQRRAEAEHELAAVIDRFVEGRSTADLIAAQALLAQLRGG